MLQSWTDKSTAKGLLKAVAIRTIPSVHITSPLNMESVFIGHAGQARILSALCTKVALMQVRDDAELHLQKVSDTMEYLPIPDDGDVLDVGGLNPKETRKTSAITTNGVPHQLRESTT